MKTIQTYFNTHLAGKYPTGEIRSLLLWTLEEVTGKTRTELLLCKDTEFSAETEEKVQKVADKLAKFCPIQYIFGKTDFCGHTFRVDEHVLIPRPETEGLVELILRENPESRLQVLDVGTGSGCIAISLKLARPDWQLMAVDKSREAIRIAQHNADENGASVRFVEQDILEANSDWGRQSIIVSNPPYICQREQRDMEPNVLDYEPHEALFVPDEDPLLFYRAIASQARQSLDEHGRLYFEINSAYGKDVVRLLQSLGYLDVCLLEDFCGLDRFVAARWKISPK